MEQQLPAHSTHTQLLDGLLVSLDEIVFLTLISSVVQPSPLSTPFTFPCQILSLLHVTQFFLRGMECSLRNIQPSSLLVHYSLNYFITLSLSDRWHDPLTLSKDGHHKSPPKVKPKHVKCHLLVGSGISYFST